MVREKKRARVFRALDVKPLRSNKVEVAFEIREAKLVGSGNNVSEVALQFKLAILKNGVGEPLILEEGWRVLNGKLYAPSRRLERAFVPINKPSQDFGKAIEGLLRGYWDAVPEIAFPGKPLLFEAVKTVDTAVESA